MPTTGAAYGLIWRAIAAALVVYAAASVPLLLLAVLLANDPPIGPLLLLQLVALNVALPALAARLIRRGLRATVSVDADALRIRRADVAIDVPRASIARVAAWAVPLPGAGFTVWLGSGRRLNRRLQLDDPLPVLASLGEPGAAAARHPTIAYAHAAAAAPWRWPHYAAKFVAFPLLPTAILFNAHQHIAYGGTLGEYYLLGFAAYVETLAAYWAVVVLYLVLYAGSWRCAAEPLALAATWAAPSRAARVRRVVEIGCAVLYYAGVPALVAVRFLS